jgi:hypothetical protein
MKTLFCSYSHSIECAYIIRVKGNLLSEKSAQECAASCDKVEMPYAFWDAYDGTSESIMEPLHHSQFMRFLKVTDHYLTKTEVACALSHISLWAKCVEEDRPIVILEHDALLLKQVKEHSLFNSICYLGSKEQVFGKWGVYKTPPHSAEGPNYHFMNRAHAYSIDPAVAKNMLAHVLKYGINMPLDMILRADIFPMHQAGIFAYDNPSEETTISARPNGGRSTVRNYELLL